MATKGKGSKKNQKKAGKFSFEVQKDVPTDLDPHLQDIILAAQAGETIDPALGTVSESGVISVDVIAKLEDPDQEVAGLHVVRKIGSIVTGTVEVSKIEAVRDDDNVLSLKRATTLHTDLRFSVPDINATQMQLRDELPAGFQTVDGSDVVVGVVDFGCDFVHNNFRNPDGTTRLVHLWDQRGEQTASSPQGFGYGREFGTAIINEALGKPDPYQFLAYDPGDRSHGTHVMDIAAGNGRATGNPGVAPNADLIFVQVAAGDFGEEESFGNSRRLLEAVDYIFEKAGELGKPAAVNISLGTHGGPHDGTTLAEQGFDQLLETPNRAIVISAGNSHDRSSHASGEIEAGDERRLTWEIGVGDFTPNELEVWYEGGTELEVTLITPTGERIGPVALGTTININRDGQRIGRIIHREDDPNNGDNQIDILLSPLIPNGDWGVELANLDQQAVSFHAWIERDDFGQSRFAAVDNDRTHTLGSISCGSSTVVVGSYDAREPGKDLSFFTSEGPTRDGKQKPEVSSPGHAIVAARSSSQSTTGKSGTSMAAPHVTGLIALLMQAEERELPIAEIRDFVLGNGRLATDVEWDSRYGRGRVDCVATLLDSLERVPVPLDTEVGTTNGRAVLDPAIVNGDLLPASELLVASIASVAERWRTRVRVQIEAEPVV